MRRRLTCVSLSRRLCVSAPPVRPVYLFCETLDSGGRYSTERRPYSEFDTSRISRSCKSGAVHAHRHLWADRFLILGKWTRDPLARPAQSSGKTWPHRYLLRTGCLLLRG